MGIFTTPSRGLERDYHQKSGSGEGKRDEAESPGDRLPRELVAVGWKNKMLAQTQAGSQQELTLKEIKEYRRNMGALAMLVHGANSPREKELGAQGASPHWEWSAPRRRLEPIAANVPQEGVAVGGIIEPRFRTLRGTPERGLLSCAHDGRGGLRGRVLFGPAIR